MQTKYTDEQILEPLQKEGEPLTVSTFKGTVTIKPPPFHERMRLPAQMGLANLVDDKGAAEGDKLTNSLSSLEALARGAETIQKYIVECDLKDPDTGEELKTSDDLFAHPECSELVIGLVMKFTTTFLTKKKKPLPEPK